MEVFRKDGFNFHKLKQINFSTQLLYVFIKKTSVLMTPKIEHEL